MAALVLSAHRLVSNVEEKIFKAHDNQKFLIDKNSTITNIDIIRENLRSHVISEKSLFQPSGLTPTESIENILQSKAIYLRLVWYDIISIFKATNFDEFFSTTLKYIEYIALTATIVVSLIRLFAPLLGFTKFSLYLLPALWRLWLLLYLLNSLVNIKFNENPVTNSCIKVGIFWIFAVIYWFWLISLLRTFAL